jgi:hypothetical protein
VNRFTVQVQADRCDRCRAEVLTTNWDDYEFATINIVADPTPLNIDQQVACIVDGRPLFTLDRTTVRTYRLARRHAWNTEHVAPWTVAIVPAHVCGQRFGGQLDDATDGDFHPRPRPVVTEPGW